MGETSDPGKASACMDISDEPISGFHSNRPYSIAQHPVPVPKSRTRLAPFSPKGQRARDPWSVNSQTLCWISDKPHQPRSLLDQGFCYTQALIFALVVGVCVFYKISQGSVIWHMGLTPSAHGVVGSPILKLML